MSPRWSPDGARIAFLRDAKKPGDFRSATQLYVINADGAGEKTIGTQQCDGQHGFTWSPDGKRIAFVRGCDANSRTEPTQLFVINADGTGETPIATDIKRSISDPAWSPAGK
jgi:Tol biopolymer transport system component